MSRFFPIFFLALIAAAQTKLDRQALVQRHTIVLTKPDAVSPLSVGNGNFAYTFDVTGLQTFPEFHAEAMPVKTQSHWGWHTLPNPKGYKLEDTFRHYDVDGRKVPYTEPVTEANRPIEAANYLRQNPHRMDLGRIGLLLPGPRKIEDLGGVRQTLDLWRGVAESRFEISGQAVVVETMAHPSMDQVAFRIRSPLVAAGKLGVTFAFPYASDDWRNPTDWGHPDRHTTRHTITGNRCVFERMLDSDRYWVAATWTAGSTLKAVGPHEYELTSQRPDTLELTVQFSPDSKMAANASVVQTRAASEASWKNFWSTGGAIDLSASKDPRWKELERRIVLSQYVTALNSAGPMPPQETGLVTNSWYGQPHLEMHWWHAARFPLWGRLPLLERSLGWYEKVMPVARALAQRQGYRGVRWMKQVGPEGDEAPSTIGSFLVWQQPHPIYFAELAWRTRGDRATLDRYKDLVFESAEFMASFPRWNESRKYFELGPPIVSAQEQAQRDRARAKNPSFELAYFVWAFEVAQKWRERLGMPRNAEWDRVAKGLAPLPVREGRYVELEVPVTRNEGHPTMLGAFGFVPPTPVVDRSIMRNTLHHVLADWEHGDTWGWDYPLIAMTGARLGEPEMAIRALFLETQKNRYLANGHNFQVVPRLPLYLPGNGGLLYAVAMMAAGWDGAPARNAPGFPEGWVVRWEGLKAAP